MDYAEAFAAPDQIVALQELTASFDFERTVLRICVEKNLDRVVRILDEGLIEIQNSTDHRVPPFVNFLVFELAEGDVRSQIDKMKKLDVSICLNILVVSDSWWKFGFDVAPGLDGHTIMRRGQSAAGWAHAREFASHRPGAW